MITVANERTPLSVACFAPWLPAELVRAAGGLAWPFRPDPSSAQARPGPGALSYSCDVARMAMHLVEAGALDDADAAIFGSGCDVARSLAASIARRLPALHVEQVHFPENVHSEAAIDWFELELERVVRGLALLAGERVGDADLDEAILAYDRVRAAIERLEVVRRTEPERLSTVELDRHLADALARPAEAAEAVLREARLRALERHVAPRRTVRVLAVGAFCQRPPRELTAALEAVGVAIVDDDMNPGLALLGSSVGLGPDRPLRRMARAFVERRRRGPPRGEPEHVLERARAAGAAAVLLLAPATCEPALLDQVLLARTLEAARVPFLRVEYGHGAPPREAACEAVAALVAKLGGP